MRTVNARAAGPRLGKDVQRVIKAVKAGQWSLSPSGAVVADGIELLASEYERKLVSKDAGAAGELPGSRRQSAGAGDGQEEAEIVPVECAHGSTSYWCSRTTVPQLHP